MKLLIAKVSHETNTFSPVRTPLAAFGLNGPDYGADALAVQRGAPTAMGAFIDLAEAMGAEMVTPISAMANPSGTVDGAAYAHICQTIVDAAPGCDALLLDLHGAMVAEGADDGDGILLERLRAACPAVPIVVSLDLHGNVTQRMVDNADIITGYKTYPHLDMYESGALAGRIFRDMLAGRATPVTAWRQIPLISHTMASATHPGTAMRAAVDRAVALESRDGIYGATVMAGFGQANIEAPCMSVIVVGKDSATAQAACDELARAIWRERQGFSYHSEDLSESVARAAAMRSGSVAGQAECGNPQGPVLLLDHGDNCMSGGSCDTMDVLAEALRQGLRNIAVGPTCDPQAVARLFEAGQGATVTLPVGNKSDLSSIGVHKEPLMLTGKVLALGDGEYVMSGPIYHGMTFGMGRTARFATEDAEIVLTERTQESWDLGNFTCVGLDPLGKDYIILKSRMYCRPVFFPHARGFVECDSRGVTSSDYGLFPFTEVQRPVYPLDEAVPFDI